MERVGFRLTSIDVLLNDLKCFLICLVILRVFDVAIARPFLSKARWFAIHAIGNTFVVITCVADACNCVLNAAECGHGDHSMWPIYFVAAIHMYHCIAFDNLRPEDWRHHIIFGGTISVMGVLWEAGPGIGLIAFFLCGLPGGIDYYMLVAVKYGMMSRFAEKRYNSRIMTWIRAPGCVVITHICWIYWNKNRDYMTVAEQVAAAVLAFLIYSNGCFYAQQVVGDAYRRDETIQSLGC